MIRALDMRKSNATTSIFLALAALLLAATIASADDRDLLRESQSDPYVFMLFDTSGSMHWTPPCTEDDARSDIDPWDGHCTSLCPFDDPGCQRICPDQGCIEYAQDASASTPIEVIVDDEDATFTGDWDPSSSGGHNGDYLFLSAGELGDITYNATLPEDGEYHVYVRWIQRNHRAENVKTTINHADGSNYLEIDQSDGTFPDSFNYLGTFRFEAATDAQVIISNRDADGGSASADAVRFSRLPPPSGLVCNAMGYRCQQPLCPQGDCQAPLGADDPTSKFFQARQALYEVLGEVPDVNFGFGSFEQDQTGLLFQHYMYRVADQTPLGLAQQELNDLLDVADQVDFTWPVIGGQEVLGTGAPYNTTSGVSDDNRMYDCDGEFGNPGDDGYDDDDEIGCTPQRPADVEDIWEMDRLARIPKLGKDTLEVTNVYVRDTDGDVYRIRYEPLTGGTYSFADATFGLQIDFERCTNDSCTSIDSLITDHAIYYDFVSRYSEWQGQAERYPQRAGGFFDNEAGVQATNTCNGLEPNDDLDANNPLYDVGGADDDAWWGYTMKNPWRFDPRGDSDIDGTPLTERVPYLDYGDFIPLDWDYKNTDHLRRRLAPNAFQLTAGSNIANSIVEYELTGETPDFRTAAYFKDTYDSQSTTYPNRRRLELKDQLEGPLYARGSTPLYASLADFAEWYAGPTGCTSGSDAPCGWRAYAEVFDLNWACKRKYVLLITDGDETCDPVSSACSIALTLRDSLQVNTFVVGYGLAEGSGNALQCIANNGGTGEPIYPRNKDELVEELLNVFDQVSAESRAFASASLPAVQSTAAANIFLSSFVPIIGNSVWPGRIDNFRQPLPLTDDRRPDISLKCDADRQSACHLWEVGEELLEQAPTDPDNMTLEPQERFEIRIGRDDDATTVNEGDDIDVKSRRVFYGQANSSRERPGPLRLFWPPDRQDTYTDAQVDRLDLAEMIVPQDDLSLYYSCDPMTEDCTAQEIALDAALQEAVKNTVSIKEENLQDGEGNLVACVGDPNDPDNLPCQYVMGDIFHSNPVVITSPSDFDFFRQDLCGTPPLSGQPNNCVPPEQFDSAADMRERGYREFARRNVWRRRMLAAATNDGQMHFFDSGKYIQIQDEELGDVEVFTDGTGNELFSYMPRMAMPIVRDQADGDNHIFSLDGTPRIDDVFVDPVPDEFGSYDPNQREWRTVMIAGMREAGDTFNSPTDVADFETGYFALDITYPDAVSPAVNDLTGDRLIYAPYVPDNPGKFLPDCLDVDDESGRQVAVDTPGCRSQSNELTPFPLELWVFQDEVLVNGTSYFLDDDRNGFRDLGATWSVPVIGQIAVCKAGGTRCAAGRPTDGTGDDVETRWVAIFGGGLDAANINNPQRGDWFFMVDIETGEAIYRRQVNGAVPSDPAVLDIDNDGIIDRVYFGTTDGTMYKIDLTADDGGDVPSITTETISDDDVMGWTAAAGEDNTVDVPRITSSVWDPFPIFNTGSPIYYPPAAFRIPELEQYGLAFGVGAREDLWEESGFEGGFFVIVDDDFTPTSPGVPFDRNSLVQFDWQEEDPINSGSAIDAIDASGNLLLLDYGSTGFRAGWTIEFPEDFKTTNEAFVLARILVFSVFDPLTISIDTGDPDASSAVCAQTGTTYSFVLSLENGRGLRREDDGSEPPTACGNRSCEQIGEFTTAIHVDPRFDHNEPPDGSAQNVGNYTGSEEDDELSNAIREAVLSQNPRSCQFNEKYEFLVSALRNSTGVNVYASIPLVICPGDWKQ
ncbi:MAG: hypothetical protein AAGM22_19085 [Acidobacteriota bacterium]